MRARMPVPENPYLLDVKARCFTEGANALRNLLKDWRRVASVEEIEAFALAKNTDVFIAGDKLSIGVKATEFHDWLMKEC